MAARSSSPLHQSAPHESGLRHATGEALYVDDLLLPPNALHGWVVTSPHAHAKVKSRTAHRALSLPGVAGVFFAEDIPGANQVGPVVHDEPMLAADTVLFRGQSVALVVAETLDAARKAAGCVDVEYEPLPAILTIAEAIERQSFLSDTHTIRRGNVDAALAGAALRFQGEVANGAQDHFYLETQVSVAIPEEHQSMRILSSTQHPSEVQAITAHVLGWGRHQVRVEVPRMGGGFGGKETQAAPFAALAALGAWKTQRPVKLWLNRDQDMAQTGKRHPFWSRFDAGFRADGTIEALRVRMYSDGGFSTDLSRAIMDRALFHLDNGYYLPNVELTGQVCKTNLPSNTAFRGFGGPQGMLVIEEVLNRAAERMGVDPTVLRRRNFYGAAPRNRTPYGQEVPAPRLERMAQALLPSADYELRRRAIETFNAGSRGLRRGIAFGVVKFGISFTTSFLNQAGALVLIYPDGTVQLNHGGTEMGQGLHTKMLAICRHVLGVPQAAVRAMITATDKVPNTSATAASSGADLNGQAVRLACEELRERLRPIAARLLNVNADAASHLVFEDGRIFPANAPETFVRFEQVTSTAYFEQTPLAATGYYRTPGIHYDRTTGTGEPFYYYAYGAAVVEVEVSRHTGEHRMLRVDILHDVGDSLVPSIDVGQIEGAFLQGVGWLTCEEVLFNAQGQLLTHSPDTYKIPSIGNMPTDIRVTLLDKAEEPKVVFGSKAVGEPPLMLALTTVCALRQAIASWAAPKSEVTMAIPATPEAVLKAIEHARKLSESPEIAGTTAP